ncbi:unnamed protein product [Fraxinus pennsylvanica]|uniref:ABC1 atypical kinase-like domain-containing protein n=1 Tax=Fraxinus pennsylvanica TaxID=56036 RepID=A0AAD2DGV8_9LAMI|nr:unnamed protein product [Fraxinus pennsylvanica]
MHPSIDIKEFKEKLSTGLPFQRSFQFWFERLISILTTRILKHILLIKLFRDILKNLRLQVFAFHDEEAQVQHPGVQKLMMTDIRNLQAFALYMQKTDIKFDLYSVTKEMERQEGSSDGIPILKLGDEIEKRGINSSGKVAAAAKQLLFVVLFLRNLLPIPGLFIIQLFYPHPRNILICRGSQVALLDYGQVKDLPDKLRLGYANLVLAIADNDSIRASESYRELRIDTLSNCEDEQKELFKMAQTMFDTKLPPGVTMLQPFSEDSSIKKIAAQNSGDQLLKKPCTLLGDSQITSPTPKVHK